METINELYNWRGLLTLIAFLIACYWLLKLVIYLIENIGRKTGIKRTILAIIEKVLLIFKPVATALILLDFISINYITHSLLLIIVSVFGYKHIKNYINGVFLKINPLIKKGALIEIGSNQGEIKDLMLFGLVINSETGERFFNYSMIENNGFSVKSNENSLLRQTLHVTTEKTKEAILDILFENPILNFDDQPIVRITEVENNYKLQFTLEPGVTTEDLIAFLKEYNISTILTNTIQN